MTSRLYVVATPIGNLSDLGERARRILLEVDLVAAEDTRVTQVLLRHVGARARTIRADEHNQQRAAQSVLEHLRAGHSVALVSDAGTPAISDPGNAIVAAAHEAGFAVVPIPGPSAVTALLSAAGLADGPFLFEGFLPARASNRDARLKLVAQAADQAGATLVLYEAPHRITATLEAIAQRFGAHRTIAIGRELTKTFEEIWRGTAAEAPQWLAQRPERTRGEFVIAIGRAPATALDAQASAGTSIDPQELLASLLPELGTSRAVRLAQRLTGLAHRELYARALALNGEAGEQQDDPPDDAGRQPGPLGDER
ncbi:MAG: 16S rRNA (cytidine(1402)-2'-O)-methyltransferase [Quisquiliibacterium sp.]